MNVNDTTLKALAASLNFRTMRQELLSSNIVNSDTPGYKAQRLSFEDALARAIDIDNQQNLQTDDVQHYNVGGGGFANLQPEVYENPNGVVSEDGNTVDRDAELAEMAENKILYDATVQLLNKKLGIMKYAISSER